MARCISPRHSRRGRHNPCPEPTAHNDVPLEHMALSGQVPETSGKSSTKACNFGVGREAKINTWLRAAQLRDKVEARHVVGRTSDFGGLEHFFHHGAQANASQRDGRRVNLADGGCRSGCPTTTRAVRRVNSQMWGSDPATGVPGSAMARCISACAPGMQRTKNKEPLLCVLRRSVGV